MPMNWKGKKGQGPEKAQKKLDTKKKASGKLQANTDGPSSQRRTKGK